MIDKEYGFPNVFIAISSKSLDCALDFLENEGSVLLQYVGTAALLAYSNNDKHNEAEKKLKDILRNKFISTIYDDLEKLPPVFYDISFIAKDEVEELLTSSLSNELIDTVSCRALIIPNKQQKTSFYGLLYLFTYLLELDLRNFERWIIKTDRMDFKIVFLDLVLSDDPGGHLKINIDNLDNSKMGILQAFSASRRYRLNFQSRVYCNEESIDNLLTSRFDVRSKFIVYLKYIVQKYHGKKHSYLLKDSDLDSMINNLMSIDYDFTMDELFAKSISYYASVYMNIIYNIKDLGKQYEFASCLFSKLLETLSLQGTPEQKIEYANVVGAMSLLMKDVSVLEKNVDKTWKELSFPYSFCKNKDWQSRMEIMFYTLIAIVIYKSEKKETFSDYIDKFLATKASHKIISLEQRSYGKDILKEVFDTIEKLSVD